jgi:hypothetical protein
VVLIVFGILFVGIGSGQGSNGDGSSFFWTCIYAASQVPLAAVSVYQEYAFKESLNMLHYIHYVTLFLMLDLLPCIPLDIWAGDTPTFQGFIDDLMWSLQCMRGIGDECADTATGVWFLVYIFVMNGGTILQAVLIKLVGAAWVSVLLSLATPLTVFTFACPWIVGADRAEPLTNSTLISAAMIFVGTLVYRLGSVPRQKVEKDDDVISTPTPYTDELMREAGVQTVLSLPPRSLKAMELFDIFLGWEEDYCYASSCGNDGNAKNLLACTGECDSDGHCTTSLTRFQRSSSKVFPECTGNGGGSPMNMNINL